MSSPPQAPPELPWPPATDLSATYDLHCHCGTIRYTITVSPPLYPEHTQSREQYTAVECTCSWCARHGEICVHPLSKDVKWTHGLEQRGEYRFANKIAPHWFCKVCASTLGGDLGPMMRSMGMEERLTINLRMLKDFDRAKLKTKPVTAMGAAPPNYNDHIDALYAQGGQQ